MLKYLRIKFRNQIIRVKEWYQHFYYIKYKRMAVTPFDTRIFDGKRVAIVGGADTATQEKNGSYIDGFDIVVRINKGVNLIDKYKDYVGTKTDLLFHSLSNNKNDLEGGSPTTISLWEKHNVKQIVFPVNSRYNEGNYVTLKNFLFMTKGGYPIEEVKLEDLKRCYKRLNGFVPTNGFIGLSLILGSSFKELYITGISFFRTPHNKDYRTGDLDHWYSHFQECNTKHNPDNEFQFLLQKVKEFNDERVKCDKGLSSIISKALNNSI